MPSEVISAKELYYVFGDLNLKNKCTWNQFMDQWKIGDSLPIESNHLTSPVFSSESVESLTYYAMRRTKAFAFQIIFDQIVWQSTYIGKMLKLAHCFVCRNEYFYSSSTIKWSYLLFNSKKKGCWLAVLWDFY